MDPSVQIPSQPRFGRHGHGHTESTTDAQLDHEIHQIKRYKDFSTIDWVEEAALENHVKRREIRRFMNNSSQTQHWRTRLSGFYYAATSWITITLVGLTIGLIAAMLNIVTEWLSDIKNGRCSAGFYLNKEFCCSGTHHESCPEWKEWASFGPFNYLLYVLFSTFFAFVGAFLVYSFAPYAAGSGISEIKCIVAGFIMEGFLGAKTLLIKSITLPLTIASGLSVGKEGPSVHYAVCVGNTIASQIEKYKRHHTKMREILCACAAAGVAVAFGSPMGGVLFSLEEISASFQLQTMWKSYFCALVSTATLAWVNPFRTGQLVLFSVSYDRGWHLFELLPFVIIGIFGGCYGIFTSKWNLRAQAFRKKFLGKYAVEEATLLATITAVICYFNQFLRIDMTESMQVLFSECEVSEDICNPDHRLRILFSLFLAVIIRTLLVIVSYGSKVPSGIFVPSMAIGALFGRFVGIIMQAIEEAHPHAAFFSTCPKDGIPCITPGTYAFLGAGAALSGIMNLTVTVVVIMFELTGALGYVLPTMIVVGTTKIIGDNWGKGGIADQAITANGFPFLDGKEDHYFGVDVTAAMTQNPASLNVNASSRDEIETFIKNNDHTGFPVINNDDYIVGTVNKTELEHVLSRQQDSNTTEVNLGKYINHSPVTVSPETPLENLVDIFAKLGPRVVVIAKHGKLIGLITRKDVLRYQYRLEHYRTMSPTPTSAAEQLDQWVWDNMVKVGSSLKMRIQRLSSSFRS